eukprot:TRINITY_DN1634_c0_g1_i1.p1 TRINITY_DN1634_c0_g1~~TRINITY_DN1634_c0_g1_i1.p1  ORF type:complete len:365 (+),score=52.23 TRINITY_DN1634_c0_g1_i1:249-1343(+)
MPDVHLGKGATVGSVIPTLRAIIPSAVGVDIGCGMSAVKTSLKATDLPQNLRNLRLTIESLIPHGRTDNGGRKDKGSYQDINTMPDLSHKLWKSQLEQGFENITQKHPLVRKGNTLNHLGTLGTGNHFIELCLDETDSVWCLLHSGSRGVGNRIGTYFIERAKKDMGKKKKDLPDVDLAYLSEGSENFNDYVEAVHWCQRFAKANRQVMMSLFLSAIQKEPSIPPFTAHLVAVDCHHNYVEKENHFGEDVWLTRKGAVRAGKGEYGIIPGSMGASTFIVRGKGNPDSFLSCSHGAGRRMSRTQARKKVTLEEHIEAVSGVECRVDSEVLDESPAAYKDIQVVMAAQQDLVEIVHTLRQVLCVKG